MSNREEMLWIIGVEGFATCAGAATLEPERSISCWFSAESKAAAPSLSNAADAEAPSSSNAAEVDLAEPSLSNAAEVDFCVPGGDGEDEGCERLRP